MKNQWVNSKQTPIKLSEVEGIDDGSIANSNIATIRFYELAARKRVRDEMERVQIALDEHMTEDDSETEHTVTVGKFQERIATLTWVLKMLNGRVASNEDLTTIEVLR